MDYSGGHVFLNVFKMSGSFLRSKRKKKKRQFERREMDPKSVRPLRKEDKQNPRHAVQFHTPRAGGQW